MTAEPVSDQPVSDAYAEAIQVPVYRLSELMFGSLLATYVLGFISISASRALSPIDPLLSNKAFAWMDRAVIASIPSMLISLSYAYLTASLYLSYHAGILTLPTAPFQRLRYDFALALAEAVAFGYSILYPRWFPFLLGLTLLGAAMRQYVEHHGLVTQLKDLFPTQTAQTAQQLGRHLPQKTESFQKRFRRLLRDHQMNLKHLDAWDCVRTSTLLLIIGMMSISATLWVFVNSLADLSSQPYVEGRIVLAQTAIVASVVMIRGHAVLKKRAQFLSHSGQTDAKQEMDKEFVRLLEALKTNQNNALNHK